MSRLVVAGLEGPASNGNKIVMPAGHSLIVPGHVVQTVVGRSTVTSSGSSASWIPCPAYALSITPKMATSKILVMARSMMAQVPGNVALQATVFRDGVNISPAVNYESYLYSTANHYTQWVFDAFDSPGSAGPLTYTPNFKSTTAGVGVTFVYNGSSFQMTLMEIAQ